jgi:succinate dehydrogenase / fumarate reductase membrane anchor subunit
MSLRSPLSKVSYLGSAKAGFSHWWSQRVSAIAIALLGIWLLIEIIAWPNFSYGELMSWFQSPITAVLLMLTIISVAYHSKLGIEVIVEDYVHNKGIKTLVLVSSTLMHFFLLALGVFSVFILFFGI